MNTQNILNIISDSLCFSACEEIKERDFVDAAHTVLLMVGMSEPSPEQYSKIFREMETLTPQELSVIFEKLIRRMRWASIITRDEYNRTNNDSKNQKLVGLKDKLLGFMEHIKQQRQNILDFLPTAEDLFDAIAPLIKGHVFRLIQEDEDMLMYRSNNKVINTLNDNKKIKVLLGNKVLFEFFSKAGEFRDEYSDKISYEGDDFILEVVIGKYENKLIFEPEKKISGIERDFHDHWEQAKALFEDGQYEASIEFFRKAAYVLAPESKIVIEGTDQEHLISKNINNFSKSIWALRETVDPEKVAHIIDRITGFKIQPKGHRIFDVLADGDKTIVNFVGEMVRVDVTLAKNVIVELSGDVLGEYKRGLQFGPSDQDDEPVLYEDDSVMIRIECKGPDRYLVIKPSEKK